MPQTAKIISAIKTGDNQQVKTLLAAQTNLIRHTDSLEEESLMHIAVASGRKEIAEFLLTQGADINARQTGGYTPLHLAAKTGNEEMIKFLLEHMADINAVTDDGQTPMELAIKNGHDAAKWFSL